MGIYRLEDTSLNRIARSGYDLVVFACGYERRARSFPERLGRKPGAEVLVFGFSDLSGEGDRAENEAYFTSAWTSARVPIDSSDDMPIYDAVASVLRVPDTGVRILVDYSSMPRLWYAGILNWARFGDHAGNVEIDFVYSVGDHKAEISPMVIDDVMCIPGCEGGPVPLSKAVAVFGLGFDGLPPLCVLDRMEPDLIYAFLAAPAAFPDYPARARKANKTLIEDHALVTLELPLGSVETTFRMLAELIEPYRKEADISLVPMGPKPHVLAAILLALRYEEVACLRVTGRRKVVENVDTNGDLVCTKVQFRPNR